MPQTVAEFHVKYQPETFVVLGDHFVHLSVSESFDLGLNAK